MAWIDCNVKTNTLVGWPLRDDVDASCYWFGFFYFISYLLSGTHRMRHWKTLRRPDTCWTWRRLGEDIFGETALFVPVSDGCGERFDTWQRGPLDCEFVVLGEVVIFLSSLLSFACVTRHSSWRGRNGRERKGTIANPFFITVLILIWRVRGYTKIILKLPR